MKKLTTGLVPLLLFGVVVLPACAQAPAAEADPQPEREARRAVWFEHLSEADVPPAPGAPPAPRIRGLRMEVLAEQFQEFDLDNDGYVNLNELTEVMERQARERAESLFSRLDKDGTGMVDQEAFSQVIRGNRMVIIEEARARAERARELHGEAMREFEIIIRDENGEIVEERRVGPHAFGAEMEAIHRGLRRARKELGNAEREIEIIIRGENGEIIEERIIQPRSAVEVEVIEETEEEGGN
ncbi:MAG: EF-hand domain pair [Idiomarinaceae bacterium HL-53]|nr:MAG: EF-hand domain pair [Idiomarinaceae bacterium HL-53]CUS47682.1 EF hand domain-containing protein [Idiomarinaceae bacterium HL-53]